MMVEKRKERIVAIPTSSMADIAFLLLTFFLVTTSLDLDKGLRLTLPPLGDVRPMSADRLSEILINDEGLVMLDGEATEVREISRIIRQKLAVQPELTVSIQTGEFTAYQRFVDVLDQVQMAEAQRISIAERN